MFRMTFFVVHVCAGPTHRLRKPTAFPLDVYFVNICRGPCLRFAQAMDLVGMLGFEPRTLALSRRCSNQLSYTPSSLSHEAKRPIHTLNRLCFDSQGRVIYQEIDPDSSTKVILRPSPKNLNPLVILRPKAEESRPLVILRPRPKNLR